jgi:hypothetical protein
MCSGRVRNLTPLVATDTENKSATIYVTFPTNMFFFRCKLLEQSLQEHNISVDNSELDKLKTELTSTDLDF